MKRASPSDLRSAAAAANEMIKAGILFVPVPVFTQEQAESTAALANQRLDEVGRSAQQEQPHDSE